MIKYIVIGFSCAIGVALLVLMIIGVKRVIQYIIETIDTRQRKAKAILRDRDIYLKKQMFEELVYIEKYKKELEQGKWPREMEIKFEYDEPLWSDEPIIECSEDGFWIRRQKRVLRLKECFKKKKGDND